MDTVAGRFISAVKRLKSERRAYEREWQRANKDKKKLSSARYYAKNSKKINEMTILWRQVNKERYNADRRKRLREDKHFNMVFRLRRRLHHVLRHTSKCDFTLNLVDCKSWTEFFAVIESKFEPGMSFDNYGRGKDHWCLDHVRPISSFDLTDPAQQRLAFHVGNLQPKWNPDNCKKSSKWNGFLHHNAWGKQRRFATLKTEQIDSRLD